jgi:hypothetical protein
MTKRNGKKTPVDVTDLDKIITEMKLQINALIDKVGETMDTAVSLAEELKAQRVLTKRLVEGVGPFMDEVEQQLINARSRNSEGFKFWVVQDALDGARNLVAETVHGEKLLQSRRKEAIALDIPALSDEQLVHLFSMNEKGEVKANDPTVEYIIPVEEVPNLRARITNIFRREPTT